MVYVDPSHPERVEGFTKNTFTAMVEGVREQALAAGSSTRRRGGAASPGSVSTTADAPRLGLAAYFHAGFRFRRSAPHRERRAGRARRAVPSNRPSDPLGPSGHNEASVWSPSVQGRM